VPTLARFVMSASLLALALPPARAHNVALTSGCSTGPERPSSCTRPTPIGGGFRSVSVRLRREFGLYANVRPLRTLIPGQRYHHIDLVLIEEKIAPGGGRSTFVSFPVPTSIGPGIR
jgi:hypothetical protein